MNLKESREVVNTLVGEFFVNSKALHQYLRTGMRGVHGALRLLVLECSVPKEGIIPFTLFIREAQSNGRNVFGHVNCVYWLLRGSRLHYIVKCDWKKWNSPRYAKTKAKWELAVHRIDDYSKNKQ